MHGSGLDPLDGFHVNGPRVDMRFGVLPMQPGKWVALAHKIGKFIIGKMGVDFCGHQIGMAKQFLDGPKIRTMLQQMGGEGMAEHMR